MRPGGYNPLRWDCDETGCFNEKCRPKIELFAKCFSGKNNFSDVDGWCERGGAFCVLEWKGPGGKVGTGQKISFENFTKLHKKNVVVVVHGNAETMDVEGYEMFVRGKHRRYKHANFDDLCDVFQRWEKWALNKSASNGKTIKLVRKYKDEE